MRTLVKSTYIQTDIYIIVEDGFEEKNQMKQWMAINKTYHNKAVWRKIKQFALS